MLSVIVDYESGAALVCERVLAHVGRAAAIITVGVVTKDQFSWVAKYPRKVVIPLHNRITALFEWQVQGSCFSREPGSGLYRWTLRAA